MTGACGTCGCDWLPCARNGECVGRLAFWWWTVTRPRQYRCERERIRSEYAKG